MTDWQDPVDRVAVLGGYEITHGTIDGTIAAGADLNIVPAVSGRRAVLLSVHFDQSADVQTSLQDTGSGQLTGLYNNLSTVVLTLDFQEIGSQITDVGLGVQIHNHDGVTSTDVGGVVVYTYL